MDCGQGFEEHQMKMVEGLRQGSVGDVRQGSVRQACVVRFMLSQLQI